MNIGSDNFLLPIRPRVIVWSKAGILIELLVQTAVKFNINSYIVVQENTFGNVVGEMTDICRVRDQSTVSLHNGIEQVGWQISTQSIKYTSNIDNN